MRTKNLLKRYCLMALLLVATFAANANPVDITTAREVGAKFLNGNTSLRISNPDNLQCVKVYCMEDGTPAFYVFNATKGNVLVSADDCAHPILGYSETAPFDVNDVPDAMEFYLQGFVEQIQYGVTHRLEAEPAIAHEWELVKATGQIKEIKGTSAVPPLITAQWGQGCYYNNLCPTDPEGTQICGHTLVGCVAVAMGQIMRYWGYPTTGNGSHTYTPLDQTTYQPSGYPAQTANFGATTYQWNNMPNALYSSSPSTQVNAVATLLWHCGVSVEMMYGVGGSGAFSEDVPYALQNYFRYSSDMQFIIRENYSDTQWLNLIKGSLNLNRPVYYSGSDTGGQGGHAFICDGYNNNDYLHFNWGWYGNWNEYYALGALNASGYQFNNNNRAIINIHPVVPSYQVTISPNPSNAGSVAFSNKGDRETTTYDFENSTMMGWTTIDGDGDGQSWELGSVAMGNTGYGHNASSDMVLSKSYDNNTGPLNPNNYLVSPSKAQYSSISFYACAQDNAWAAEHFGVAVSTTNNTNASAFTTIQEWTMTAKGNGVPAPGRGGDRTQGNWYQYTVDLSAYSGQPIYVAIRHFNCSDYFYLDVDDISLTTGGGGGGNSTSAYFNQGQSCTVTATPNSGYYFANWTENGSVVSTTANYTFTVEDARNLVANFTTQPLPQQYTINISANPSNGGSVAFGSKGVADGTWYYYDNGVNVDAVGLTNGGSFYWGVMFPAGQFEGNTLTKVSMYDYSSHTGNVMIYQGGSTAPGTLLATIPYTCTGSSSFIEVTLSSPLTINPAQNLWVVLCNNEGQYVAACCDNTGDANGRWISLDGTNWADVTTYNLNYTWMIRAFIEQGGGGGISATYTEGQSCTVVATPNSGYTFTNWTENGTPVSTSASYTFTVNNNRTLVANFTVQTQSYTVSVSANPSEGGTVTGGGTYTQGQSCTVTATANSGYTFTNWTENGTPVSTSASYTFTVNSNRILVANFTQIQSYTITVSADPANGGTVSGGGTYLNGVTCSLTASPNTGFIFENWTNNGAVVSTNPSFSFTVTENATYVAHFVVQTNSFTITVSADPVEGGVVSGGGNYEQGAVCTLTATPNTGYEFVNWTKNGTVVSTNASFSFNVSENASYIAHFSINTFTVTVSADPSEGGLVTGSGTYTYGEMVTVTVAPNAQYTFLNWTENGTEVSQDLSYSFTVNSDRQLVAHLSFVTGIEEMDAKGVLAYPNPAHDKLFVECGEQIVACELYTTVGTWMGRVEAESMKAEIPLNNLSSGMYLVKVITEDQVMIVRFVKE